MDLGQLKTQVLTMSMMKSGSSGSGNNDIMMIMYSMIMLNLIEWLFKQVPAMIAAGQIFLASQFSKRTEQWKPLLETLSTDTKKINSITLTRVYKKDEKDRHNTDNSVLEKVDAVLDYICSLDNATHIRMDTRTSLNCTEDIELTPLLKAKIKQVTNEDSTTEVVLFSTIWKISDIRSWIDEIHSNYVAEKNNKLGNRIYYFNEMVVEPQRVLDMSSISGPGQGLGQGQGQGKEKGQSEPQYRWDTMPKSLVFRMNEFKTNKSFSNVYGTHVNELKERMDLFINHPEWYIERGIPHTLGVLLHGVPGSGKTSTIKALIKDTHRHPFNISLREFTTQTQLTNLFYNENVMVQMADGTRQTLRIPLNKRIYIIEDIDCLTDVVLDRNLFPNKSNASAGGGSDALTLSFVLNLIDGVLETPGRGLVVTSNKPERLDSAFIRPGRIDVKIAFGYTDRDYIYDMFKRFYTLKDDDISKDEIPDVITNIFTPAEIMESLCNFYKSWPDALQKLIVKSKTHVVYKEHGSSMLADLNEETESGLGSGTETMQKEKTSVSEEPIKPSQDAGYLQIEQADSEAVVPHIKKSDDKTQGLMNPMNPVEVQKKFQDLLDQRSTSYYPQEAQKDKSQSSIHIKEQEIHQKGNPQSRMIQKKDIINVPQFFSIDDNNNWASAMFESDVTPEGAGGHMPGQ